MPDLTSHRNDYDDGLLVAAVVKGETGAFRELISRYEKLVVSIVFKMVDRREDCEDICQDVFLKVFERIKTFRYESKLSTWIGSVTFNTCVNFLRKNKPVLLHDMTNPPDDDEDTQATAEIRIMEGSNMPDERLLVKEQEAFLLKCIHDLSVTQRTILQLFHHNELSLQEISTVTKLPISTVKSHLFRARKRLKQKMVEFK